MNRAKTTGKRTHLLVRAASLYACVLLCLSLPIRAQPHSTTKTDKIAPSSTLDAGLKDFRLDEVESRLRSMPPGPESDYFAGMLANRNNRIEDSLRLLQRALPGIRASQPARAALALEAMADDYVKSFRYREAAQAYDDLLSHFAQQIDHHRLQGTRDDAALLHLLASVPPQTISWQGPTQLKTERNPIGSLVTELTVNGVREKWLLDTGANFSVLSQSFARELGLKPLPGFAQTGSGLTGLENKLQVAIVPELHMGGASIRNVVVMIMDDSNLKIVMGKDSYQIKAVVGYPVFQALGVISFHHNGEFLAGEGARSADQTARLYMRRLTPVLLCGIEGQQLPLTFDSGASDTELSFRYFQRFQKQVRSWKRESFIIAGAGGNIRRRTYTLSRLPLNLAGKNANLKSVAILPTETGGGIDELYGNLGQDLLALFDSLTLDFSRMTFSLGAPLPAPKI